jgi:dCTP deaminase
MNPSESQRIRVDLAQWAPGLLCDRQIDHLCREHEMIRPYVASPVRSETNSASEHRGVVSYGASHYGYDIRIADEFKVFKPTSCAPIDPKGMHDDAFDTVSAGVSDHVLIPPHSFVLARSVEHFKIPRDVLGVVLGKSTYARCGLIVNCTPLEPEWCGWLTIEISNTTPLPAKVYVNEGIAQVLFFMGSQPCALSYAEKFGKYQDQPQRVVLPKV